MPRFPALLGLALMLPAAFAAPTLTPIGYRVQLDVVSEGFDGKTCWFTRAPAPSRARLRPWC